MTLNIYEIIPVKLFFHITNMHISGDYDIREKWLEFNEICINSSLFYFFFRKYTDE